MLIDSEEEALNYYYICIERAKHSLVYCKLVMLR